MQQYAGVTSATDWRLSTDIYIPGSLVLSAPIPWWPIAQKRVPLWVLLDRLLSG